MKFQLILRTSILFMGLFTLIRGYGQYQQRTFVQQDVITVSGVKTIAEALDLGSDQRVRSRVYQDGLGRTVQQINVGASPSLKDLVQPVAYDNTGRNAMDYLPYQVNATDGLYRSQSLQEQAQFYTNGPGNIAKDTKPYSARLFENSPLGRILKEGNIGENHQPSQHASSQSYRANVAADGARQWNADGSVGTNYAAGSLRVSETTLSDGQRVQLFVDRDGRTVLSRSYLNETVEGAAETWLDTYYVYDDLGNIRFMIPPKAVIAMRKSSNWSLLQASIVDQIFSYLYSNKSQLIEKREPAAGTVYYVYDPLDRLVLVQDAQLRAANKWHYVKYDVRDQAIGRGIYSDNQRTTRTAMQSYVQSLNYSAVRYERRNNSATTGYYSNTVFPTTSLEPLAYVYFDDYDLNKDGSADYSYQQQGLEGEHATSGFLQGMLTVVRERSIGDGLSSVWLTQAYFYNERGEAIQTRSNNQFNSNLEDSETQVSDFTGKTLRSRSIKKIGASGTLSTITVDNMYGYDHVGRLRQVDQKYGSAATIRVADYIYNELGQLIDKKLHSTNNGGSFLQSIDYRYNIRGQLLSINSSNLGTSVHNDDANDLFGMELLYDKVEAALGNTAYYSGRISAVKWRSKTASDNNPKEKTYLMAYDPLDRMKSPSYKDRLGAASWGSAGGFDEKGLSYDGNGNILTLQRNALISGTLTSIDNLTYSYSGDKLTNVAEPATGSLGTYGFRNLTGSTADYAYDAVGALAVDPKKGISLSYNTLGLTAKVTVTTATGRYVDYTYTAGGALLRTRHFEGGIVVKTLDYIGGYVYENSSLSYFSTSEGRVRNISGTLKSEYMLTDHQGNVRVSFEEQGGVAVVRQENSYYPFGLQFPGTVIPSGANRQLYNGGSEWENAFGNLPDLYRTGYRMYDPALGRFASPDPLASSSVGYGTYHYGSNNPMMFNDPLGLKAAPGGSGGGNVIIDAIYALGTGQNWHYSSNSGWDSAPMNDLDAFMSIAYMINDSGAWGTGGIANSYSDAANTFNSGSHTGGNASLSILLHSVTVQVNNESSLASGIQNVERQVAALWSENSTFGNSLSPFESWLRQFNEFLPTTAVLNSISYAFSEKNIYGDNMNMGEAIFGAANILPIGKIGGAAIRGAGKIAAKTGTKLLPEAYSRFSRFEYHFGKHAGEWGAVTKNAYYKRALSLLDGSVGGNIQGFTNTAGYTFRINMRTGEFGVMRPNGVVETFYRRLNDPAKYWAEQVAKWNK